MFTKEHYIAIAKLLRSIKERMLLFESDEMLFNMIVDGFVSLFKNDSSNFNVERFENVVHGKEVSKSEEK